MKQIPTNRYSMRSMSYVLISPNMLRYSVLHGLLERELIRNNKLTYW